LQGTITPIERSFTFDSKFPDKILDEIQLQRFLESRNYILDFYHNMSRITKPLYDRLIKILVPWFDEHTKIVRQINKQVQEIPCLHIVNPLALKIVGMGVFLSKYKITKNKFFNLHLHIRMIVKRSILLYKKKLFPLCYALQNFNVIYQIKISFTN
jgi:hypothetical protein